MLDHWKKIAQYAHKVEGLSVWARKSRRHWKWDCDVAYNGTACQINGDSTVAEMRAALMLIVDALEAAGIARRGVFLRTNVVTPRGVELAWQAPDYDLLQIPSDHDGDEAKALAVLIGNVLEAM